MAVMAAAAQQTGSVTAIRFSNSPTDRFLALACLQRWLLFLMRQFLGLLNYPGAAERMGQCEGNVPRRRQ